MRLVEQHHIKKSHKFYEECSDLCFRSKNVYNAANYVVRQSFIKDNFFVNSYALQKQFQGTSVDYLNLPAKVSQQTLRLLEKNWKSFFAAIKEYKKNPDKFLGRPKLPKYKDSIKGRFPAIYDKQAISKAVANATGKLKLSKTNIHVDTNVEFENVKQVRIIPKYDFFVIEVVYIKDETPITNLDKEAVLGIDLGVNNLCAIAVTTDNSSVLINGKPLKAINQYYNKKKAKMQSILPVTGGTTKESKGTSVAIRKLSNKRNNKVNNYLHKVSKKIVDLCLTKNVGTIVIGKNVNQKQNINIGKRNNQNFVSIPFARLISMISYKAEMLGIDVVTTEESYTSKCSALDNEKLQKHTKYAGRRIKRGLFRTKLRKLINADTNGSLNIIRKVFPNFVLTKDRIEGFAVGPRLLNV